MAWVLVSKASIAKGVEEKISGEQRRFFLMEQLKAIKKVRSDCGEVVTWVKRTTVLNFSG